MVTLNFHFDDKAMALDYNKYLTEKMKSNGGMPAGILAGIKAVWHQLILYLYSSLLQCNKTIKSPLSLKGVLDEAVQMINFVKSLLSF